MSTTHVLQAHLKNASNIAVSIRMSGKGERAMMSMGEFECLWQIARAYAVLPTCKDVIASNRGNIAIQQECWVLETEEARQYMKAYNPGKGTYYEGLARSYRRARRAHETTCRFTTGGFATGEFANQLRALDIAVSERESYR
jgi:hypothetical protein